VEHRVIELEFNDHYPMGTTVTVIVKSCQRIISVINDAAVYAANSQQAAGFSRSFFQTVD
jgi:hypothetical protein